MYSPILSPRDEIVGMIPPPLGIMPNFANPPSRAHVVIIFQIVCAIVSTLFVGLRLYTTLFITRNVKVDDYLLVVAWFLALACSVAGSIWTRYGIGRHLWDVPVSLFSPNCMKVGAIGSTLYGISIMLTKISILTFFTRFLLRGSFRVAIYIIIVIVALYSLVTSFEWVYACRPLEKYWDLSITRGSCINWNKITVFSGVMNTATDSAILILPVLMLRNLRLPKRQKIGVMLILMTGGFVLIISIIRLKLTVDLLSTTDYTWGAVSLVLWSTIEAHLAIVCACLPAGKPFLRKYMPKIIGGSYGASVGTKRRTTHSTHTRHLPSKDEGEDSQNIILEGDLSSKLWGSPTNVSSTSVELGTMQPVRAEYGSDKGLIIMGSGDAENGGPSSLPTH